MERKRTFFSESGLTLEFKTRDEVPSIFELSDDELMYQKVEHGVDYAICSVCIWRGIRSEAKYAWVVVEMNSDFRPYPVELGDCEEVLCEDCYQRRIAEKE